MKAGRNDPCPCGSGKKYKKCCLASDREQLSDDPLEPPQDVRDAAAPWDGDSPEPSEWSDEPLRPELTAAMSSGDDKRSDDASADDAEVQPDPLQEAQNALSDQFEACDYRGQAALFLQTVDTPELLTHGMAAELLDAIRQGAEQHDDWNAFEILIRAFQECLPDTFDESAACCISWLIDERVAHGRLGDLAPLARELAAHAGDAIDSFDLTLDSLAYHCDLATLVEVMRIAWPGIKSSDEILPWGVEESADRAFRYEMLWHSGQATSPRPDDPALTERLEFYVDPIKQDSVTTFVLSVSGQAQRIALDAHWENESCEPLCLQFLGHLIREEGVAAGKADLGCENLCSYLLKRLNGRLEQSPDLYAPGRRPRKRKGKARRMQRRAVHVLCPDTKTLDPYLAQQLDFFSARYHTVAATMEIIPAWLRFLESRQLVDSREHHGTLRDLAGLQADLLRLWNNHPGDPSLHPASERAWQELQSKPQKTCVLD